MMKSQEGISTKKDNLESDGKSCWKKEVYKTLQKRLDEKQSTIDWLKKKVS